MLNQAIMMGRLCADPEPRKTQSEISVCSIRIAVDRDYGKGLAALAPDADCAGVVGVRPCFCGDHPRAAARKRDLK